MEKIIIAAIAENNVIGKNGKIPWYSKEDFRHFKKTTIGYPIIMGRKTFESIGRPLKERTSIVISSQKNYTTGYDEVKVFNNLQSAIKFCEKKAFEKVFFIGGSKIYEQTINSADKLIISYMPFKVEGDTFFPLINENDWEIESVKEFSDFKVVEYISKRSY